MIHQFERTSKNHINPNFKSITWGNLFLFLFFSFVKISSHTQHQNDLKRRQEDGKKAHNLKNQLTHSFLGVSRLQHINGGGSWPLCQHMAEQRRGILSLASSIYRLFMAQGNGAWLYNIDILVEEGKRILGIFWEEMREWRNGWNIGKKNIF